MNSYTSACFPDRWRILGLRLQPFCLGHALLLERYGSPFANAFQGEPIGEVGFADLLLAIFICSKPYPQAAEAMGRGLGLSYRLFAWRCWWFAWRRPYAFVGRAAMFQRYMFDGVDGPKTFSHGESGRPPGTPMLLAVKQAGVIVGYSPAEALTVPWSQLLWEIAARKEAAGLLEVLNDAEREAINRREPLNR